MAAEIFTYRVNAPSGRGRQGEVSAANAAVAARGGCCYPGPVTRTVFALVSLLLCARRASAAEFRAGFQYAGHLLFTDVVAAGVQWRVLNRPERTFLRELNVQTGLALSFDGEFVEVPALVRFELLHRWKMGFELAPGFVLSHFEGTSALTPVLCAGVPLTEGRFRLQPELCLNMSAGPPGGPSYMGGLWTGLGIGAFYAF